MSKGRYRGSRKRDFDDYDFSPPPDFQLGSPRPIASDAAGPAMDATVKWFNPDKGFGFVELTDGSGDAFLHINVLQRAGHEAVEPGAQLSVQVGDGAKGRQVSAVLSVSEGAGPPPVQRARPPQSRPARRPSMDASEAITVTGVVKWFNAQKGFGFVEADDGLKDVFVHASIVEQAGLPSLAEGQPLSMQVVETAKGREAVAVSVSE